MLTLRNILFMVLLFLPLLSGCVTTEAGSETPSQNIETGPEAPPQNLEAEKPAEQEIDGFSFSCPVGWKISESQFRGASTGYVDTLRFMCEGEEGEPIKISVFQTNDADPEDVATNQIKERENLIMNLGGTWFTTDSISPMTVNGIKVAKGEFRYIHAFTEFNGHLTAFKCNENWITVTMEVPLGEHEAEDQTYENLLNSISCIPSQKVLNTSQVNTSGSAHAYEIANISLSCPSGWSSVLFTSFNKSTLNYSEFKQIRCSTGGRGYVDANIFKSGAENLEEAALNHMLFEKSYFESIGAKNFAQTDFKETELNDYAALESDYEFEVESINYKGHAVALACGDVWVVILARAPESRFESDTAKYAEVYDSYVCP